MTCAGKGWLGLAVWNNDRCRLQNMLEASVRCSSGGWNAHLQLRLALMRSRCWRRDIRVHGGVGMSGDLQRDLRSDLSCISRRLATLPLRHVHALGLIELR